MDEKASVTPGGRKRHSYQQLEKPANDIRVMNSFGTAQLIILNP
jgi:hypothetical protein